MELEKIIEIISEKMDIDKEEITGETTFESLQVDSLDMVEIVMDIEEAFDMSIEASPDLKTVGDLVDYIKAAQA
ncbi:MAG: acyl carrier protein [Christensenellales bacterium]|jgi:acyl carrier protein